MLKDYTVYITETVIRPVRVVAETPADAERVAEETYNSGSMLPPTLSPATVKVSRLLYVTRLKLCYSYLVLRCCNHMSRCHRPIATDAFASRHENIIAYME